MTLEDVSSYLTTKLYENEVLYSNVVTSKEIDKRGETKTYTINQTDNYYGIDVESIQSGTYQKYNDDFMTNIFEQNIGDSSVL